MSTTLIEEVLTTGIDYNSRLLLMHSSRPESLADYVRRVRNEKSLSTPEVERHSGGRITDAYVSRIENGLVKNVSPEKLSALAKGLDVSEDEIFAIARGKSVSGELPLREIGLLYAFRTLPLEKQDDLIAYAEMMRIRYGSQEEDQHRTLVDRPVYRAVAGIPKALKGKNQKKSDTP